MIDSPATRGRRYGSSFSDTALRGQTDPPIRVPALALVARRLLDRTSADRDGPEQPRDPLGARAAGLRSALDQGVHTVRQGLGVQDQPGDALHEALELLNREGCLRRPTYR